MSAPAPQIFISYHRSDGEFARRVREHLVARGVKTWMDQNDIPVGAYWPDEIDKGLAASDTVVGILSPDAVGSRNVKNEWDWAIQNDKRLLLLQVNPCVVPHRYVSINFIDATSDDPSQTFAELSRTLGVAETPATSLDHADQETQSIRHSSSRRRTRLLKPLVVGREGEQTLLHAALAELQEGNGSLVLIGGEAGIGKTTLTTWLVAVADESGALALAGGCEDLAMMPPYGPWVDILRQWPADSALPSVPAELQGGDALGRIQTQAALFNVAATFFSHAATVRPLVLLLEDLHWADQASLDLLRFLARRLAGQRIMLVVTWRDDEVTRKHPLHAVLPSLAREPYAVRLDLRHLGVAAVRELIAARYQLTPADAELLTAHVARLSDGNPFFAGELLRALQESGAIVRDDLGSWRLQQLDGAQVPVLIRQVIDGRLERLGDAARRLLEIAAAIGYEVPIDVWVEVSGGDDAMLADALERASDALLVEELRGSNAVRFTHALVRETLYEGMVVLRRRGIHRRIGEALDGQHNPDPDAVAHHYQQAGDPRAYHWLIRAAERAEHSFAWIGAAQRYEAALTLLGETPESAPQRALLLYRIGFLLRYAERTRSQGYIETAVRLAIESGNHAVEAVARFDHGVHRFFLGDWDGGLAEMRAADTLFESLTPAEQISVIGRPGVPVDTRPVNDNRGMLLFLTWDGQLQRGLEALQQYVASLPADPSAGLVPTRTRWIDGIYGLMLHQILRGDVPGALRSYERALQAYQAVDDTVMVQDLMRFTLRDLYLPYLTDHIAERAQLSTASAHATVTLLRAVSPALADNEDASTPLSTLMLNGDWETLRRSIAVQHDLATEFMQGEYSSILAWLERQCGAPDQVWGVIDELLPEGPATPMGRRVPWTVIRLQTLAAETALDQGDLIAARTWLNALDRMFSEYNALVFGHAESILVRARWHWLSGAPEIAAQHARHALALASTPRQPLALIAAQRFLGQIETAANELGSAEQHLAASLQLAKACETPHEIALTWIALAELRAAQGRNADADCLLTDARSTCERLGAQPALTRIAAIELGLNQSPSS